MVGPNIACAWARTSSSGGGVPGGASGGRLAECMNASSSDHSPGIGDFGAYTVNRKSLSPRRALLDLIRPPLLCSQAKVVRGHLIRLSRDDEPEYAPGAGPEAVLGSILVRSPTLCSGSSVVWDSGICGICVVGFD